MYEDLIKRLNAYSAEHQKHGGITAEAADAIEELYKAASAMHEWIFLNCGDEQAVYDECGLSDRMNTALGYGGQFVAELPKGEDSEDEE